MAKRAAKPVREGDQYMIRMPPGLRERIARRAAENGRSISSEIVDAIEKHLEGADRITELWDLFEKHRENLEAIPEIWNAVENLEYVIQHQLGVEVSWLHGLRGWQYRKEAEARKAPAAEQAERGRALKEKADALTEQLRAVKERIRIEEAAEKEKDAPA